VKNTGSPSLSAPTTVPTPVIFEFRRSPLENIKIPGMVHSNKRMSVVAQASYQGCLPRLKKTNHSRKNPTILPIAFFNHIIMKLFIESIDYGINVIRLSYSGRCWVVAILNVLASSAVDRGFELRSGQTK
jgi:hypothetical protein